MTPNKTITPRGEETPRGYKYDVIVCGGGTSGVAAAISAARAGAKTLLIEKLGTLGGQMNVTGPPGFSYAYLYNARGERVVDGLIGETHERLLKEGHARPSELNEYRSGSDYIFSFVDPDWWGLLIFQMMVESDVRLLLHSLVVDVIKNGDSVHGVVVENAAGRQYFEAKVVIECTGEGDIAVRAGCEYELLPRNQNEPHTVCFTLDGINWDETLAYIKANPDQILPRGDVDRSDDERYELIRKVKNIEELGDMLGFFKIMDEALKNGDWHQFSGMGFFVAPKDDGRILAHCQHSAQVANLWSCDPWDLSYGEIENRRQIVIAIDTFRKYMPGFQKAYLTKMGVGMRLRDGRRIMGDYVLGWDDVIEGRRHYDCYGKCTFHAGAVHVADNRTIAPLNQLQKGMSRGTAGPPNKGTYDLPYRMLVPRKIENLLIAGKHVSADRCAYQRFLHETMMSGQAAGVAAALCMKLGVTPRELEDENYIKQFHEVLKSQRVIIDGVN